MRALHLTLVAWWLWPPGHQDSRAQSVPADLLTRLHARDFGVRRDAVRACHGSTAPEVLAALRERLRQDEHPNIRAFALEELMHVRPPDLFALAQEVLHDADANLYVRQVALQALGATRDPRAYAVLLPLLSGPDAAYAARGLAALGDPRAFPPMADLLARRADEVPVRELLPRALIELDRERGVDHLLALFSRDDTMAWACAYPLAQQPLARIRTAMLTHLDDPSLGVRRAAVLVLGATADAGCLDALLKVFDRDPELRPVCADALARSRLGPAARPLCERLHNDADPDHRSAIAGALRSLKDPAIVPDLLRILARESDDLVRVQIVAALGAQGDRKAVAALIALLDDTAFTKQPMHLSRIMTFPHNVRLGDVAVWAAALLVDDKEPFPVERLSAFPQPAPRAECAAARARLQSWWQQLADRVPFGGSR